MSCEILHHEQCFSEHLRIFSEMATKLAADLSRLYPDWANVFSLQNSGKFNDALIAVGKINCQDKASLLFLQLFQAKLKVFIDAVKGIRPSSTFSDNVRSLSESAEADQVFAVRVEALFFLFDTFPELQTEAANTLTPLEPEMDPITLRRWLHRKGNNLIREGRLHEAHELWSPLVSSKPGDLEDFDDSLCSLLIDLGRLSTELGKYSDAVEIYNQALACARSPHNQGLSLIRLSNALERMSRPAQADKRRIEYYNLIKREYPTHCSACSVAFGKEPKFLIPCCKTIVHSECLRQAVSDIEPNETDCMFCHTKCTIADVVDPGAVEGRKYKKTRRGEQGGEPVAETAVDI